MLRLSVPLSFLLLFTMFFTACEQNALVKRENGACCYPLVIKENGKIAMEISYNDQNLPINLKEYDNGNLQQEAEIEYNDGKKVRLQYYDADGNPLQYLIFQYNASNLLAEANHYQKNQSGNLSLIKRISYQYNTKKQISKEFHYLQIDSSLTLHKYFTYTYNSAGNVSLQKDYNEVGEETSTTNFEYDSQNNAYGKLPFFNTLHNLNRNNVKNLEKKNPFDEISNESYSSIFTYNEHGFPVKEIRSFAGGTDVKEIEIQYNCVSCN